MKRNGLHFFLLLLLFNCFSRVASAASGSEKALYAQLEILLPGSNAQAHSTRQYARQRILDLIDGLEAQKISKKKPEKVIEMMQASVQKELLTQYEALADLTTLFTKGTYDQSSASIVYALLMDHLVVPYRFQIREAEIALVVYPETEARLLKVIHAPDFSEETQRHFQAAYLEFLNTTGTVANHPHATPDILFTHYYPGQEEPLDMTTVASFLCYRQALKAYNEKAWMKTLDRLNCARQLEESPAYDVLEKAVYLQLAQTESSGRESLYYLWELWKDQPEDALQTELVNRFNKAITSLPEASVWVIDSLYLSFHDKFTDHPQAQSQLKEMYFLQRARFHAQEGKYFPVMDFMDSLYQLRPNDLEVHHVIGFMLAKTLQPIRDYQEGLDRVNDYHKRYPFLRYNLVFQDRNFYFHAERVHALFANDQQEEGQHYFDEFIALYQQIGRTAHYESWLTTSYLAISNYYFRQKAYPQALQYIDQALRELPTDDYLLHRRDLLRRYLR
ncbi:MAG: hypothetical protein AAGJ93_14745 [Bacteroidota bacterium]